jgi:hypothetical protein
MVAELGHMFKNARSFTGTVSIISLNIVLVMTEGTVRLSHNFS